MASGYLLVIGALLIASTWKRPMWLGGLRWRYASDEMVYAMVTRASRASLGGYLILSGGLFWVVGL